MLSSTLRLPKAFPCKLTVIEPPIRVVGLDHIVLTTSNVDDILAFYAKCARTRGRPEVHCTSTEVLQTDCSALRAMRAASTSTVPTGTSSNCGAIERRLPAAFTMSEAAKNWRIRTFASLSHDNYRKFFFSQAVSLTG